MYVHDTDFHASKWIPWLLLLKQVLSKMIFPIMKLPVLNIDVFYHIPCDIEYSRGLGSSFL